MARAELTEEFLALERLLFEAAYQSTHDHRRVKDNAHLLRRDSVNQSDYAKFEVQKSWELWQIRAWIALNQGVTA